MHTTITGHDRSSFKCTDRQQDYVYYRSKPLHHCSTKSHYWETRIQQFFLLLISHSTGGSEGEWKGEREGGWRENEREGGMEEGREEGWEAAKESGREGGREGRRRMEGGWERERVRRMEGGREGGSEGGGWREGGKEREREERSAWMSMHSFPLFLSQEYAQDYTEREYFTD